MSEGGAPAGPVPESRALTGLRGVGALLVMAHHLYLRVGLDQHMPFLQWGLRRGYLGVDLFFVLSGFVMSMVYGTWFRGLRPGAGRAYPHFVLRRVARIWPLHAAMVLLLIAVGLAQGRDAFTLREVAENLAMVQAWGHGTEINAPAWSISTEFMAYLLFPLLAAVALRGVWRPLLAAVGVAVAFWACIHLAPPIGPVRRGWLDVHYNYSALPALRCLGGFVTGMLAWRVGRAGWVQGAVAGGWVGTVLLVAMLVMLVGRVNDVFVFLLMPWIVLSLHHGRGAAWRALASGPMHGLGVISYAVYLVHFPLLNWFVRGGYPLRYMLPAYVVATLVLAMAAHVAIERPGRGVIRRVGEGALARG